MTVLRLRVFVRENPPQGEEARTVHAVQAAAARLPGQVEVAVVSLASAEAAGLGLSTSPTVVEGDTVLSVGGLPSAGRLKRYLEAELAARGVAPGSRE